MAGHGFQEVRWSKLEKPGDLFAVSCDLDGPSIGPVRLLKRSPNGLEPRPAAELDFVLSQALGYRTNFEERVGGLKAVAAALKKGDIAHAMLVTQFMWLPTLADEKAARRAVNADTLAKAGYSPSEPRDDRGRWSSDGLSGGNFTSGSRQGPDQNLMPVQGFAPVIPLLEQILPVRPLPTLPPFPGEIMPPPAIDVPGGAIPQVLPRTLDNPYPDDRGCAQEWEDAKQYCHRLADAGWLGIGDYKEHGRYFEQCVRGQVSERCGGNPVDRTSGRRRPTA